MNEKPILFSTPMVRAILDGRKTMTRRVVKCDSIVDNKPYWNIGGFREGNFPYQVGIWLWVRETWQGTKDCISYKASDPQQVVEFNYEPWRPSIFMPRWASRITLEITNVRVERLHEITEEDAEKEGVSFTQYTNANARFHFMELWDSINSKKYPWESNPWVWVIEFKRLEKI